MPADKLTFQENLAKAREFGGTGMEPYLDAALAQYNETRQALEKVFGLTDYYGNNFPGNEGKFFSEVEQAAGEVLYPEHFPREETYPDAEGREVLRQNTENHDHTDLTKCGSECILELQEAVTEAETRANENGYMVLALQKRIGNAMEILSFHDGDEIPPRIHDALLRALLASTETDG